MYYNKLSLLNGRIATLPDGTGKQKEDQMKRVKTLINWAFSILMASLILFAVSMLIFTILGWKFNPVVSGSMDPLIKTGDVVATQQVDPANVKVGDIITYYSPQIGKVVVHRVIEKQEGEQLNFVTKGDANESADPYLVPSENVLSKVGFHIPCLGYVSQFATSGSGIVLLFVLPGLLIVGKQFENIQWRFSKARKHREEPVAVRVFSAGQRWTTGLRSTEDWLNDQVAI